MLRKAGAERGLARVGRDIAMAEERISLGYDDESTIYKSLEWLELIQEMEREQEMIDIYTKQVEDLIYVPGFEKERKPFEKIR